MKRMKNLLSLVLALVMVMAMTLTAMAQTVENQSGHTYNAYQIFAADFDVETTTDETGEVTSKEEILSNIKWGTGVNASALVDGLKKATEFGSPNPFASIPSILENSSEDDKSKVAKAVAEVLKNNPGQANTFAQFVFKYLSSVSTSIGAGESSVLLDDGYYLFIDTTSDDGYVNLNLLEVTGTDEKIVIKPKNAVPTVGKEVEDESVADDATENGWGQTADHQLFKNFSFKLTAELPAATQISNYKTYKVVFHDSMSPGVTYVPGQTPEIEISFTPASDEEEVEEKEVIKNPEDVNVASSFNADGTTLTVTFEDIKTVIEKTYPKFQYEKYNITITVTYTAYLNAAAAVASPDTNPNPGGNKNDVYLEYSNNPNVSGEGQTKTTPEETVWVFTYKMPNEKQAEDGSHLKGAGFTLFSGDDSTTPVNLVAVKKDGTLADPSTFLRKNESGEIIGIIEAGLDEIDYYRVASNTETGQSITQIYSNGDGGFNIVGLDVGTYTLKETLTPPGYNTCDPVEVKIASTHEEAADGESASATVTMTKNNESASKITIINQKGVTLPETGGIGTTIFTVSGIILVIIAGVLLVTKKRMSKEE